MPATWAGWKPKAPVLAPQLGVPTGQNETTNPVNPAQPTGPVVTQPGWGNQTAPPTAAPTPAPSPGGGGAPPGFDLGPFQSYDQWVQQFTAEHGRAPDTTSHYTAAGVESNDYMDMQDSVNFWRKMGRGPTAREWKNRYYTGSWFGYNSGWGGGGGGGGGGSTQAAGSAWGMPGMFWQW